MDQAKSDPLTDDRVPEETIPDIQNRAVAVYEGPESTTFSIYGTSPENPSGTQLCFMRYADVTRGGYSAPRVTATLCIKDLKTDEITDVADAEVTNHNGANAVWVDDDLVAFQKKFEVYNVSTRQRLFRKRGELGHQAVDGVIPFTIGNFHSGYHGFASQPVPPDEEGIYVLSMETGRREQILSMPAIMEAVRERHAGISTHNVRLMHLDPSPGGDRFLFDYRCDAWEEKQGGFFQGVVNSDGSDCRIIPIRCAHTLWFDDDSFFGPRDGKTSRYDLNGTRMEVLGGTTCHAAKSNDNAWLAGDIKPGDTGITSLVLYERGHLEPAAVVATWGHPHVTWEWVAHANPAFSPDGQRLYFVRAAADDRFEACCFPMDVAFG